MIDTTLEKLNDETEKAIRDVETGNVPIIPVPSNLSEAEFIKILERELSKIDWFFH